MKKIVVVEKEQEPTVVLIDESEHITVTVSNGIDYKQEDFTKTDLAKIRKNPQEARVIIEKKNIKPLKKS